RHDGVADQCGIPNLSQLDQPCTAGKATAELGRNSDREAGLADTARSDQADQAGRSELPSEFRKLATAAAEACRPSREVARATAGPGHGQEEANTRPASQGADD